MNLRTNGTKARFAGASLALGAALAAIAIFPSASPSRALAAPPNNAANPADEPHQYTGPGSCSSTSCHGSIAPRADNRVKQNEYSVWIVRDKHSKAYQALTGMVGERMASILNIGRAEEAPKCLACHALDVPAADRARTFDLSEGVSCESCHGPASAWLGHHTERNWTHEQSVQAGMTDLRDVGLRTQKCLSCHLGGKDKFVDHQMIAAGHPDLYFELDSFSASMPRHWNEPGEPGEAEGTDQWYEVREWSAGQAVQLRQSLLQLADQTRSTDWPEYSQLECYACHHSLGPAEQSWRQARGYPDRRPGDPPWNASRYIVFREIVREVDPSAAQNLDAGILQLAKLMSSLNPDRGAVASAASSTAQFADQLASKFDSMPYDRDLTMRVLQRICSDSDSISNQDEHAAAQAAMALQSLFVAYDRNEKPANAPEVRTAIAGLFSQLQVPSGYDANSFARQMHQVGTLLH
ncbi:MAG TPA: multiheme c-type cytochrome [Candidatus Aquilonibacter sp.]|nr:multiheme c-type cytochrome [Candidatus Aquilonibacter sp.]